MAGAGAQQASPAHRPCPPQMFVRLFVDENLDRMVPISKQPKEKIQAIIESCSRQFPEFQERARKRIRTYLKSCRRMKKNGMEMVSPQHPPPPQPRSSTSGSRHCGLRFTEELRPQPCLAHLFARGLCTPTVAPSPFLSADQTHTSPPDLGHGRKHPGSCLRERDEKSSQKDAPGDLPVLSGACLLPAAGGRPQPPRRSQAPGAGGVGRASSDREVLGRAGRPKSPDTKALQTSEGPLDFISSAKRVFSQAGTDQICLEHRREMGVWGRPWARQPGREAELCRSPH